MQEYAIGSYVTGVFFMFFFGHLMFGFKDPESQITVRYLAGMFWPLVAVCFLTVRLFRGLNEFFDCKGDR